MPWLLKVITSVEKLSVVLQGDFESQVSNLTSFNKRLFVTVMTASYLVKWRL